MIGINFFLSVSGLSRMVSMDRATSLLTDCKSVSSSCHGNLTVDCFAIVVGVVLYNNTGYEKSHHFKSPTNLEAGLFQKHTLHLWQQNSLTSSEQMLEMLVMP